MNFGNNSIGKEYNRIGNWISNKILLESDSFILGASTDELIEYYFSNNHFTPIEIDSDRQETVEIKKEWKIIPAHKRDGPFKNMGDLSFECSSIILTIPIKQNDKLDPIKEFEVSDPVLEIAWGHDFILGVIEIIGYGFNKSNEDVQKELQSLKQNIYRLIDVLAIQINERNNGLKSEIRKCIENRKQKIENDNERYNSLLKTIDIPIKKKEDEAVKRIQLDTRPIIQRVRPTATVPEEYIIDRQKVLDIIHILDNQGRQFEKTPKTYLNNEEEDLRNVLLVGLNTVFEGKATGETFMAKGKTDIYLNIDKGNILVCECKFWGGQKLYKETINQLLGYLTWRNNYGIIITFSKIKNLSKSILESSEAVKSHTTYRQGFTSISETHFQSRHNLPMDEHKNVELHHLFYNLYI